MSFNPPLYAERSDWADVTPQAQYENVNPLAPIFYTEEYKDATDYFRGIVKAGEMSERVLELTEHIIRLNPAHYTAWQYRYKTLLAIKAPLDAELHLMDELAVKYLKTYQVWHHRRLLLTQTRKPVPELQFIARSLTEDEKNYHTWSYRQWLLAYFNDDELWAGELDFVEQMLKEDIRNNSAWHHRFFTVFQSGTRTGDENRDEVIRRELTYVKQSISQAPNNASAWNYLRGVLDHSHMSYSTLQLFVQPYSIPHSPGETVADVIDLENPPPWKDSQLPCPAAIEFLADIYEVEGGNSLSKANELWKSLADEYDPIRKKYWEYRIREASQNVGLAVVQNTCNFECPVFQTLPLYPTGVYQNQTQTPPDLDFANIYDSLEHFIMSSTPKHSHEIGVHWNSLRKRSILPGGFGDDRVALWPRLLGVNPTPATSTPRTSISPSITTNDSDDHQPSPPPSSDSDDAPDGPSSKPHRDEHQIHLDTERSFVFYPSGTLKNRYILQARLHDLLVAIFRKRRLLCYFQGYHDITTVIFLTLPPALHLPCIEKLSLHRIRDSMGAGLEPVLGLLRVLKNLLSLADPGYASLLEQTSPLPYHALSNLLTLFAHDIPTLPLIQHVFDWLLCRPPVAVVYLAAAVILSRKEEVKRLEEKGEEGMVHSLLCGLPELLDGGGGEDQEEIGEMAEFARDANLKPVEKVPLHDSVNKPDGPKDGILPAPNLEMTEPEIILHDLAAADDWDPVLESGARFPSVSVSDSSSSSLVDESPQHSTLPKSETLEMGLDGITYSSLSSSFPSPTISTSSLSDSDSQPPPKRTRIQLSTLLTHADELYASYPPTHPSLCLSEIMAPQSVVFTWSESDSFDALGDDEAEAVILHPELVVYPYIEALPSSDGAEEDKGKRKWKKSTKLFGMETRTALMVAGAVLVLGVSVGMAAAYGARAGSGGAGGKSWSLRRVGGQVRGVLVGASELVGEGFGLW